MKIHRSYYKEYLFFFGTDEQATGEGALGQQVDDLLAANVAVGAMCGFFDEAYTLLRQRIRTEQSRLYGRRVRSAFSRQLHERGLSRRSRCRSKGIGR